MTLDKNDKWGFGEAFFEKLVIIDGVVPSENVDYQGIFPLSNNRTATCTVSSGYGTPNYQQYHLGCVFDRNSSPKQIRLLARLLAASARIVYQKVLGNE